MTDTTQSARRHILVVEDEPIVQLMVADLAAAAGFDVVSASTADEALARVASCGDIALLFTDIDMPGTMDGLALARIFHRKWPGSAVVVASGKQSPPADALPDGAVFLAKPYDPRALVHLVAKMAMPRRGGQPSA